MSDGAGPIIQHLAPGLRACRWCASWRDRRPYPCRVCHGHGWLTDAEYSAAALAEKPATAERGMQPSAAVLGHLVARLDGAARAALVEYVAGLGDAELVPLVLDFVMLETTGGELRAALATMSQTEQDANESLTSDRGEV